MIEGANEGLEWGIGTEGWVAGEKCIEDCAQAVDVGCVSAATRTRRAARPSGA